MDNPSPGTDTDTEQPAAGPTGPTGPTGPRVGRDDVKDLGRLRRSVTDRHIAGVAGGLARHLDIDPIIVRVVLVVGIFFGGAGLLAYVGAWVLVPEEGSADEPLGLDKRNRTIALVGVGILAVLCAVGDWAGAFWFPWPLAILAALVVWFLHRKDRGSARPRSGYGYSSGRPDQNPYAAAYQSGDAAPAGEPATAPYAAPADGATGETYAEPDTRSYAEHDAQPPYAWVPPTTYVRERPRNPRRRGPILFGFTLALIALGIGVLGVVDLAGVAVAGSAYPALALAITAVMLLVGAFWGRAGGLIALGLVAALGTAAATVGDDFDAGDRAYTPTTSAQLRDSYDFGGGRFTLDLSEVSDVDALDGRDIAIDGVGGRIEVIVPDGVDVDVRTSVVGGSSRVFDQRSDGFDVAQNGFLDGGTQAPDMSITIDLVGGEILVREAA
ncbi:PspC domain-containing protein [Nocardioides hwasunensis]|uniref:PspC domain-containing protein n=1 Tax=Nocardioides hwasunensis TaxID=397258 RepID=A0ABR8MDV3_9ACTN|nr:PspC domain-containing protein [Nocardioides hwasunensis]MBD3914138.1 PspC domain-containing protein [Nocardioides hwasunensis]